MRLVKLDARILLLLSAMACGDSGGGEADGSTGGSTDDGGSTSPSTGGGNGDGSDTTSGQATGDSNDQDQVSGTYSDGAADALTPTRGFVYTDPRDQNSELVAYKIILTAQPSVGCAIKDLDTKLANIGRFDEGADKVRYLSCRIRSSDIGGRHPATLLGVDIGGFGAIGPGQLECLPAFENMGKTAGDRVVGSMRWVDPERGDAEVGNFQFDLQYCGDIDTLSM